MNIEKHSQLDVYYDGTCRMCNAFVDTLEISSERETFVTHDATQSSLPQGVTLANAMTEIHVVEKDGTVHRGGDAILRIMDEHPVWRFFSFFGKLPGIRQCVRATYRLVAAHRHQIPWRKL